MEDLTGFQRDLLWILAKTGELHGLGVKDAYDNEFETDVQTGRLYPNLDTLVEMGLIVKGDVDGRTNSYRLSRRGRRELQDRVEWERSQLEDDGQEVEN